MTFFSFKSYCRIAVLTGGVFFILGCATEFRPAGPTKKTQPTSPTSSSQTADFTTQINTPVVINIGPMSNLNQRAIKPGRGARISILPKLGEISQLNEVLGSMVYTPLPGATGIDRFSIERGDLLSKQTYQSNVSVNILANGVGPSPSPGLNINALSPTPTPAATNESPTPSPTASVTPPPTPVNRPPTAEPLIITVLEDSSVVGTLPATDPDGDRLKFIIMKQPENGTLVLLDNGPEFLYTPNANFPTFEISNVDFFAFQATDGRLNSQTSTVRITVLPSNDRPIAVPQTISLNSLTSKRGFLQGTGIEGRDLTFSIVRVGTDPAPRFGTVDLSDASSGDFVYTSTSPSAQEDYFHFQVSDGVRPSKIARVSVEILTFIRGAASSERTTCAIVRGALKCWGKDRTTFTYIAPRVEGGLIGGVKQVVGARDHFCALVNGGVKSWGSNDSYQLGRPINPIIGYDDTPLDVPTLNNEVTYISAGTQNSCAIKNGALYCWGWNGYGQLGIITTTQYKTDPTIVAGLDTGVTRVSVTEGALCLIQNDKVKCLGRGYQHNPIEITNLTGRQITEIASSYYENCAIVDGGLKCWKNDCQTICPVPTSPIETYTPGNLTSNVTSISGAKEHMCAVVGGVTKCWTSMKNILGNPSGNELGVLGNGTIFYSTTPVDVWSLEGDVAFVSTGPSTTCAAVAGVLKCTGSNLGKLGFDYNIPANYPAIPLEWQDWPPLSILNANYATIPFAITLE